MKKWIVLWLACALSAGAMTAQKRQSSKITDIPLPPPASAVVEPQEVM